MKHISLIVILVLASLQTFAALEDNESSIKADRQKFISHKRKASDIKRFNPKPSAAYTAHEFNIGATRVHEFVDAHGSIFAVAWLGGNRPDLSILLGRHFANFSAAEKAQVHNLATRYHPAPVEFANVRIERGGIVGSTWGRAYLTDKLPAGVTEKDLQ